MIGEPLITRFYSRKLVIHTSIVRGLGNGEGKSLVLGCSVSILTLMNIMDIHYHLLCDKLLTPLSSPFPLLSSLYLNGCRAQLQLFTGRAAVKKGSPWGAKEHSMEPPSSSDLFSC